MNILVERTSVNVKFSVPASSVEIEIMEGLDSKPIKVEDLLLPFLQDYTIYKSISNTHESDKYKFSRSRTNGVVS